MLIMIIAGLWATAQLSRQLLPTFALNVITVNVTWQGASATDVEALVTQPLEDELLGVDDLRSMESTSRDGQSQLSLEFPYTADMTLALDQVKDLVAQVRNLPENAEDPQVSRLTRSEGVSKLLVAGPVLEQLRPLVRGFERELRARGLARIEVSGLPAEEIAIELAASRLIELNLSLTDVANRVALASTDVPAGTVGGADVARQLRGVDQRRSVTGFAELPVAAEQGGRLLRLGDVARINRVYRDDQALLSVNGQPAVEIAVSRSEDEDAISVAQDMLAWVATARADLPPNVVIYAYDEPWRLVDQRIDLMVNNALSGMVLVVIALYIFLNGRVAFWVAVGVPVSILAALVVLWLAGGSINIMTLFALIMTFGIIVDDAIVVGEEAVTLYQQGAGPLAAAEKSAFRMLAPVAAASLTTVAAFLPLTAIGGPTGRILFAIPLVVICVIIASLLECFLVLPGHLRHSLQGTAERPPGRFRRGVDVAVNRFRDGRYRRAVDWSVANRGTTISLAIAGLILIFGLLGGGFVGFAFFPQPEANTVTANVRFVAGAPEERVAAFMQDAVAALREVETESGEELIRLIVTKAREDNRGSTGSQLGHIIAELVPSDQRSLSNKELSRVWRSRMNLPPGLEAFLILGGNAGPPGSDIEVELTGRDVETLKAAALNLSDELLEYEGVSGIRDDTPFGKEQLIFELSSTGTAAGLTGQSLGEQLRAAFEGELVQIFQDRGEEVEVRVRLASGERESLRALATLPIVLPDGEITALSNVARLRYSRGFDTLKHSNGLLAVTVSADVDFSKNNANVVRTQLSTGALPRLTTDYGVAWTFRGDAENQAESFGDVGLALPLALLLVYIILAWVFGSYLWPLAVLSVIPFGLVGAIFGHWLLGFDVTMLSIFGFFGLSGIVINDSIILVMVFKELREKGVGAIEAAVEASCRRLRAVALTSLTTVVGVGPLLFETAVQAQFLKPMVIALSFGLIFGTGIVLFLLPAFLVTIESARARLTAIRSDLSRRFGAPQASPALASGDPQTLSTDDPIAYGGDWSRDR
jgi:multidrug efflux pump subunit AcrB